MAAFTLAKSSHSASIWALIVPSSLAETTTCPSLTKSTDWAMRTSKSSCTSGVRKAEALITVSVDALNHLSVALRKACTTES
eukprot:6939889-Prymnesium_polylepis.1